MSHDPDATYMGTPVCSAGTRPRARRVHPAPTRRIRVTGQLFWISEAVGYAGYSRAREPGYTGGTQGYPAFLVGEQ
jgi:hypothetical protein